MIGAYVQTTWIEGTEVSLRDLQITRSRSQRMLSMDFRTDSIIDSNVDALLAVGNEFRAQIDVDGTTRDYYGDIASIHQNRATNYTEYRVEVEGREARLTRRRFSARWLGLTAKAILDDAWSQFGGGLGLTFSPGAGTGPTIDEISIEEGTLFEVFEEVAEIADWAWQVNNTTVVTFDPATEAKGRAIVQDDGDITRGTVDIRNDAKRIINSMRAVAWETRTIQQSRDVTTDDCVKILTIPRYDSIWEVVESTLALNGGDPISGTADLQSGEFRVSSPYEPLENGTLELEVEIRRPVVFEVVDDPSVATYGPRYGPTYKDDGGLSYTAVETLVQNVIDRLKDPEVTLSLQVERWPWDNEIRTDVTLTDPAFTRTMVVDSVTITSAGGRDAEISLELVDLGDRRQGTEPDPALVMAKRIEDLERRGFHPDSRIGRMLNGIGLLSFDQYTEVWEHGDEFRTGLDAVYSDDTTVVLSNDETLQWSGG